jgi:fibronectin-binding autotransporter adhesin
MKVKISSTRRVRRHSSLIAAAAALSLVNHAFAASGSWTGNAGTADAPDLSWNNAANWDSGVIPGAANGTFTNTDTATFAGSINSVTEASGTIDVPVTVDPNRTIGSILFSSPSLPFLIGTATGTTLHLTGGGTGSVVSSVATTTSFAISAPIEIDGSSYTFIDTSGTNSSGLKLNGGIAGGNNGSPTTVFLDGTLAPNNATSGINTQINSSISDGSSSSVSVIKNGIGTWQIASPGNSYSGDTVVNQGSLRLIGGAGSTGGTTLIQPGSPNSALILNSGGNVRFNFTGSSQTLNTVYKSLTVNAGASFSGSSGTLVDLNLVGTLTGPALMLNEAPATTGVTAGINTFLIGTTPGAGGVTITTSDTTGQITWSKNIDLGNVNRIFSVPMSAANAGGVDFQVTGRISGAGGIIKTGNGVLKIEGNDASGGGTTGQDTFSGPLEIQAGAVRFNAANELVNTPALIVDGGTLNVQGFVQTFGNATLSAGTLQGSNPSPGTVSAASITMPIAAGTSATASAILAADSITKTGNGTFASSVSLSAGTLNVSGGAFTLNANGGNLVTVDTLNIGNGGKLDLSDNDMIVNVTDAATVRGYLASGFNAGNWNGVGIASKSAGANPAMNTALGYALQSDVQLASLDGATPAASSVIVKYTYYGDTNLDGTVTTADFGRFLDGLVNHGSTWAQGDFTYDGHVDLGNDYNLFLAGYLQSGGQLGALADVVDGDSQLTVTQKASLLAAIPEPSSIAILALTGVTAMRRRRRS